MVDRGGRLVFHVVAELAEFERDLIRERTNAGLAAARARGRKGGRPSVMTPDKLAVAREMYASGEHTVAELLKGPALAPRVLLGRLRAGCTPPRSAAPASQGPA